MILRQHLESMVVDISIDVELREQVERLFKLLTFRRSWMGGKDWEEVCRPKDSIKMYDGSCRPTVGKTIRFNDMHASDIVRCIGCAREPMHQGAFVLHSI